MVNPVGPRNISPLGAPSLGKIIPVKGVPGPWPCWPEPQGPRHGWLETPVFVGLSPGSFLPGDILLNLGPAFLPPREWPKEVEVISAAASLGP